MVLKNFKSLEYKARIRGRGDEGRKFRKKSFGKGNAKI